MKDGQRIYSRSIRTRIEAAILFTTAVVLAIAYVVLMAYEWRQLERDIKHSMRMEAGIIASNSTAALAFQSPDDARFVLSSGVSDERIQAVFLYDNEGRLFASYVKPGLTLEAPARPGWVGEVVEGGLVWVTAEVAERNESMGKLVLAGSLRSRSARMVTFGLLMGGVFAVGLLLAMMMSGLLKRRIAAPMLELTEAVDRVGRNKDYSFRVKDDSNDEVGVLAHAFNEMLAEVERRDQALSEREREFRALVEQSPDLICRYGRDMRITYMSPASTVLMGRPPGFYAGKHLNELNFSPETRKLWESSIRRVLETGRATLIEHDVQTSERGTLSLHTRIVPEVNDSGEVTAVLAIARDITERRRQEEALRNAKDQAEAAARSKSTFLANMSHDIRTPLTSIIGFAEILSERLTSDDRELSDMIREGGRRLLETLNSVLDLARLEGGTAQLTRKRLDVGRELQNLCALFRPRAEEKGLSLICTLPGEPTVAMVDGAAFGRIMINLIGNALKFTNQGEIHVDLSASDHELTVAVSDTGPGIPDEFLPQIFDAFTRSRASESDRVEGSGLGLTISRQLAGLIGAQLAVKSSQGVGSTFTLTLQRAKSLADEELPQDTTIDGLKSILIAEDNPNIQTLLRVILAPRFAITISDRSDEAVEQAKRRHFDLVLMDIALESSEAGIEGMRRIRRLRSYDAVPIIAFTAHALPEEAERFRKLGFNDLLQKPFSPRQLNELLARFLG